MVRPPFDGGCVRLLTSQNASLDLPLDVEDDGPMDSEDGDSSTATAEDDLEDSRIDVYWVDVYLEVSVA